jgi:uncharacterized membrane protein
MSKPRRSRKLTDFVSLGVVIFGQLIPYKKMSLIDVMLACEGQKTRDRSSPQKLTQVNYHQNQKTNLCLSVTCILSSTLVFLISVLTRVFLRAVQEFLGVINGRSNSSSSQKFTEVNYHQNQKTNLCLSVTCILSSTLVHILFKHSNQSMSKDSSRISLLYVMNSRLKCLENLDDAIKVCNSKWDDLILATLLY